MKLTRIPAIRLLALVTLAFGFAGCGKKESSAAPEGAAKNVIVLTKANFDAEVLKSSQPVLVDFWASWCGPCKMIAPVVAELAGEYDGKARFGKVDVVDAQSELAQQYGITSIPALLFFKDGKLADQLVGVRSKAELKAKLETLVSGSAAAASGEPRR